MKRRDKFSDTYDLLNINRLFQKVLVTKICLNTPFLWGGGLLPKQLLNDVKSPEKLMYDIQFDEKCLKGVSWQLSQLLKYSHIGT